MVLFDFVPYETEKSKVREQKKVDRLLNECMALCD